MKHSHRILPLFALCLLLSGCGTSTPSVKPSSTGQNTAGSSSNPSNTSGKPNTGTQNPSIRPEDIDKESIIAELAEGFQAESVITTGNDALGYNDNYYCFEATEKAYSFRKYQQGEVGYAKKEYISSEGLYEPFSNSGIEYLTQVELELDNKLHNYYLVSSGTNYLKWDEAGFYNPFNELYGDDFAQESKNPYRFDLVMGQEEKKEIYNAFATAFTGTVGYTLAGFTLITDGITATGYEISFEDIKGTYGTTKTSVKGTFAEDKGEDVVKLISPIKGEEKEDLKARFQLLKQGNYKADVTLPNRSYKAEVYGGNSVVYDLFKNDKKTGNYGYYQTKEGSVQGITKIGDNIYQDSDAITGNMSSMIPGFNISSVLFTKSEASTSEKTIYTMDKSISKNISVSGITYGLLGGTILGTLTVELENDRTTIINDLGDIGRETFVYYDVSKVQDFTTDIKESCDNLTWSELFSNQPNELEMLNKEIIQKDYLDQIPTFGGKSSYLSLSKNNKTGLIQAIVAISDYKDGENKVNAYKTKAEALGFESKKVQGQTPHYVFSKDVTINGTTKNVSIDVLLAASYFNTPNIVVSFSCR